MSVRRSHALAVTVLVVVAGCDGLFVDQVPTEVVAPEVVGMVEEVEHEADGMYVVLTGAGEIVLPTDAEAVDGVVAEGSLLIYDDEPLPGRSDGPWYVSLPPLPSGCIRLPANGEVRADRMALSDGFSLPLSSEWQETETRFVDRPAKGFCLDEAGEVTRPYS